MKISKFVISVLWLVVLGSSAVQGFYLTTSGFARRFGAFGSWIIILPAIIIISSLIVQSLPGETTLGALIDKRYGQGVYLRLLEQLKPELLFACMSFITGIISLQQSLSLGGGRDVFISSGFFINGGASFLVAHFVMRRRGLYDYGADDDQH